MKDTLLKDRDRSKRREKRKKGPEPSGFQTRRPLGRKVCHYHSATVPQSTSTSHMILWFQNNQWNKKIPKCILPKLLPIKKYPLVDSVRSWNCKKFLFNQKNIFFMKNIKTHGFASLALKREIKVIKVRFPKFILILKSIFLQKLSYCLLFRM